MGLDGDRFVITGEPQLEDNNFQSELASFNASIQQARDNISALREDLQAMPTFGNMLSQSLERTASLAKSLDNNIKSFSRKTSDEERTSAMAQMRATRDELDTLMSLQNGSSNFGISTAKAFASSISSELAAELDKAAPRLANIIRTKTSAAYQGRDAYRQSSMFDISSLMMRDPQVQRIMNNGLKAQMGEAQTQKFFEMLVANSMPHVRLDDYTRSRFKTVVNRNATVGMPTDPLDLLPASFKSSYEHRGYQQRNVRQDNKVLTSQSMSQLVDLIAKSPVFAKSVEESGLAHRNSGGLLELNDNITREQFEHLREAAYHRLERHAGGAGIRTNYNSLYDGIDPSLDARKRQRARQYIAKRLVSGNTSRALMDLQVLDSLDADQAWDTTRRTSQPFVIHNEARRLLDAYGVNKYTLFGSRPGSQRVTINESEMTRLLGLQSRGHNANASDVMSLISLDGLDKNNAEHMKILNQLYANGAYIDKEGVHLEDGEGRTHMVVHAAHRDENGAVLRMISSAARDRAAATDSAWAKAHGFRGNAFNLYMGDNPQFSNLTEYGKYEDALNKLWTPSAVTGMRFKGNQKMAIIDTAGANGQNYLDGIGFVSDSILPYAMQFRGGAAFKGSLRQLPGETNRDFAIRTGLATKDNNGDYHWMVRSPNGEMFDAIDYNGFMSSSLIKNMQAYKDENGKFYDAQTINTMATDVLNHLPIGAMVNYNTRNQRANSLGTQLTEYLRISPELQEHQIKQYMQRLAELDTEEGMLRYVFSNPETDYMSKMVQDPANRHLLYTDQYQRRVQNYRNSLADRMRNHEFIDFSSGAGAFSNVENSMNPLTAFLQANGISDTTMTLARNALESHYNRQYLDDEIKDILLLRRSKDANGNIVSNVADFSQKNQKHVAYGRNPTALGGFVVGNNRAEELGIILNAMAHNIPAGMNPDDFATALVDTGGVMLGQEDWEALQSADLDGDLIKRVLGKYVDMIQTSKDVHASRLAAARQREHKNANVRWDEIQTDGPIGFSPNVRVEDAIRLNEEAASMGGSDAAARRVNLVDIMNDANAVYVLGSEEGTQAYGYTSTSRKKPGNLTVGSEYYTNLKLGREFTKYDEAALFNVDEEALEALQATGSNDHLFKASNGLVIDMDALKNMDLLHTNMPSVYNSAQLMAIEAQRSRYEAGQVDTSRQDAVSEAITHLIQNDPSFSAFGPAAKRFAQAYMQMFPQFSSGERGITTPMEEQEFRVLAMNARDEIKNSLLATQIKQGLAGTGMIQDESGEMVELSKREAELLKILGLSERGKGINVLDNMLNNFGPTVGNLLQSGASSSHLQYISNAEGTTLVGPDQNMAQAKQQVLDALHEEVEALGNAADVKEAATNDEQQTTHSINRESERYKEFQRKYTDYLVTQADIKKKYDEEIALNSTVLGADSEQNIANAKKARAKELARSTREINKEVKDWKTIYGLTDEEIQMVKTDAQNDFKSGADLISGFVKPVVQAAAEESAASVVAAVDNNVQQTTQPQVDVKDIQASLSKVEQMRVAAADLLQTYGNAKAAFNKDIYANPNQPAANRYFGAERAKRANFNNSVDEFIRTYGNDPDLETSSIINQLESARQDYASSYWKATRASSKNATSRLMESLRRSAIGEESFEKRHEDIRAAQKKVDEMDAWREAFIKDREGAGFLKDDGSFMLQEDQDAYNEMLKNIKQASTYRNKFINNTVAGSAHDISKETKSEETFLERIRKGRSGYSPLEAIRAYYAEQDEQLNEFIDAKTEQVQRIEDILGSKDENGNDVYGANDPIRLQQEARLSNIQSRIQSAKDLLSNLSNMESADIEKYIAQISTMQTIAELSGMQQTEQASTNADLMRAHYMMSRTPYGIGVFGRARQYNDQQYWNYYGQQSRVYNDILSQRSKIAELEYTRDYEHANMPTMQAVDQAKIDAATTSLHALEDAFEQTSEAMNHFGSNGGLVATALINISHSLEGVVKQFGKRLFHRAFSEAKNFVQEFDKAMTEIQMVTLKSDEQINSLGKNFIQVAQRLKAPVSDVTSAATSLYRQGLTDEEVNDRLENVIKFTKTAGVKATEAVKLITVSLNAGVVDSAQQALDVISALGDAAATTASEITKGLQKSLYSAAQAGASYNEVVAMLTAITANTQMSGTVAGTALQTMSSRYTKVGTNELIYDENGNQVSGSDLRTLLQSIGIVTTDAQGKNKSITSVLAEMAEQWDTLSDARKGQLSYAFGGTRQFSNFSALMSAFSEEDENGETAIAKYLRLAEDSEGLTDEKHAHYLESLQAAVDNLTTSFDGLVEAMVDNGVLTGFLDFVTSAIQGVTQLANGVGSLADHLSLIVPLAATIGGFLFGGPAGLLIGALGAGVTLASMNDVNDRLGGQAQTNNQTYAMTSARISDEVVTRKNEADEIVEYARKINKRRDENGNLNAQDQSLLVSAFQELDRLGLMSINAASDITALASSAENTAKALDSVQNSANQLSDRQKTELAYSFATNLNNAKRSYEQEARMLALDEMSDNAYFAGTGQKMPGVTKKAAAQSVINNIKKGIPSSYSDYDINALADIIQMLDLTGMKWFNGKSLTSYTATDLAGFLYQYMRYPGLSMFAGEEDAMSTLEAEVNNAVFGESNRKKNPKGFGFENKDNIDAFLKDILPADEQQYLQSYSEAMVKDLNNGVEDYTTYAKQWLDKSYRQTVLQGKPSEDVVDIDRFFGPAFAASLSTNNIGSRFDDLYNWFQEQAFIRSEGTNMERSILEDLQTQVNLGSEGNFPYFEALTQDEDFAQALMRLGTETDKGFVLNDNITSADYDYLLEVIASKSKNFSAATYKTKNATKNSAMNAVKKLQNGESWDKLNQTEKKDIAAVFGNELTSQLINGTFDFETGQGSLNRHGNAYLYGTSLYSNKELARMAQNVINTYQFDNLSDEAMSALSSFSPSLMQYMDALSMDEETRSAKGIDLHQLRQEVIYDIKVTGYDELVKLNGITQTISENIKTITENKNASKTAEAYSAGVSEVTNGIEVYNAMQRLSARNALDTDYALIAQALHLKESDVRTWTDNDRLSYIPDIRNMRNQSINGANELFKVLPEGKALEFERRMAEVGLHWDEQSESFVLDSEFYKNDTAAKRPFTEANANAATMYQAESDYANAYNTLMTRFYNRATGEYDLTGFNNELLNNASINFLQTLSNTDFASLLAQGNGTGIASLLTSGAFGTKAYNPLSSDFNNQAAMRYYNALISGNVNTLNEITSNSGISEAMTAWVSNWNDLMMQVLSGSPLTAEQINSVRNERASKMLAYRYSLSPDSYDKDIMLGSSSLYGSEAERKAYLGQLEDKVAQSEVNKSIINSMRGTQNVNDLALMKEIAREVGWSNTKVDAMTGSEAEVEALFTDLTNQSSDLANSLAALEDACSGFYDVIHAITEGLSKENTQDWTFDNISTWANSASGKDTEAIRRERINDLLTIATQAGSGTEFLTQLQNSDIEWTNNKELVKKMISDSELAPIFSDLFKEENGVLTPVEGADYSVFTERLRNASVYAGLGYDGMYSARMGQLDALAGGGAGSFLAGLSNGSITPEMMTGWMTSDNTGLEAWIQSVNGGKEALQAFTDTTKDTSQNAKQLFNALNNEGVRGMRSFGDYTDDVVENLEGLNKNAASSLKTTAGLIKQMNQYSDMATAASKMRGANGKGVAGKALKNQDLKVISQATGLDEAALKKLGADQMLALAEGMEDAANEGYLQNIGQTIREQLQSSLMAATGGDPIKLSEYIDLEMLADGQLDASEVAEVAQRLRDEGLANLASYAGLIGTLALKISKEGGEVTVETILNALGDASSVTGSLTPSNKGYRGGGGGGGGGGKGKSATDKLLQNVKNRITVADHRIKMAQLQEEKYNQIGMLGNENNMIEYENTLQRDKAGRLAENIVKLRNQLKTVERGSDDWQKLYEQILKYEEELDQTNNTITANTIKMQQNQSAIRKSRTDLEDLVVQEIEARIQKQREMLAASVEMQDMIVEAIRQRYQEEWDIQKKDLEKKREALEEEKSLIDKRLQMRKDAEDEAKKYEELEEYRRQLAMISMDSTRTKDAAQLREKIAQTEDELAWKTAENEANAQKESIDDQIKGIERYEQYGDEDLALLLEDANNFASDVADVMQMNQQDMFDWLKNNVKEYSHSLEDAQTQMVQSWEDTYKQMLGITDTYWDQVDEILSSKNNFAEFMMASDTFKNASETQKQELLYQWLDAITSGSYIYYMHAQQNWATYSHDDEEFADYIGGDGSGGGGGSGGPGGNNNKPGNNDTDNSTSTWWGVFDDKGKLVKRFDSKSRAEAYLNMIAYNDGYFVAPIGKPKPTTTAAGSSSKTNKHPSLVSATPYSEGGDVNYTGLAMVHGTPARPEAFLDAEDRANMRAILDSGFMVSMRNMVASFEKLNTSRYVPHIFGDDMYTSDAKVTVGDINISTETINDEADFELLAKKIGQEFIKDLSMQGIGTNKFSF